MKSLLLSLPAALLLGACAGDTHTTQQSPPQTVRTAGNVTTPERAQFTNRSSRVFARHRIYQITRLETAGTPRGEWRAVGENIRQQGSSISFTELGSNREISFTGPHQITPTNSGSDRASELGLTDTPSDMASSPGNPR